MNNEKVSRFIRNILSEKNDNYTFFPFTNQDLYIPDKIGLYIHIPFCKSMCPYCPYYKVFYDKKLADKFSSALIKEIDGYNEETGKMDITSIYIGGGTPTLLIYDLKSIINKIRASYNVAQETAIETTPSDVSEDKVKILKEVGVNYISLGVQSFQQKYLSLIGRNYDANRALSAVRMIKKYQFDTFNIDLIFAFPLEDLSELVKDLQTAVSFSPDQITCYPLFTFPYSTIGKYRKIKKLKMPSYRKRKKMYYLIHDFFEEKGYWRSSVWSFNREKTKPYSSVTRDYYIGFGPSAGSYTGKGFYFNTFSVSEYIKTVSQRKPIALEMRVSNRMEKLFWFYWRLYETVIPKKGYKKMFGKDIHSDFGKILSIIKTLGFIQSEDDETITLNKRGCLWLHLAQNYAALNYVSRIWSVAQKATWPEKITL